MGMKEDVERLRTTLLILVLAILVLFIGLYKMNDWWSAQKALAVLEAKTITACIDDEKYVLNRESIWRDKCNVYLDSQPRSISYGDEVATLLFDKGFSATVKIYALSEEMPDDRRSVFLLNGRSCVAVVQNTSFLKNSLVLNPEAFIEPIFEHIEALT